MTGLPDVRWARWRDLTDASACFSLGRCDGRSPGSPPKRCVDWSRQS